MVVFHEIVNDWQQPQFAITALNHANAQFGAGDKPEDEWKSVSDCAVVTFRNMEEMK